MSFERILSNNPQRTTIHFARANLLQRGYEAFDNRRAKLGEFFDDFFDKRDNVDS